MIIPARQPHPATQGDIGNDIFVDADDADKRILNGSNIAQLQNKSISSYANFSQGIIANQPLYTDAAINGHGAIYVDVVGSSKRLISVNPGTFPLIFYISFIYQFATYSTSTRHVFGIDFGFAIATHGILRSGSGFMQSQYYALGWGTETITGTTFIAFNTPYLIEVLYDGSTSRHELYVNGNLEASTTNVHNNSFTKTNATLMNSGNTGLNLSAKGYMGGVLFRRGSIPLDEIRFWRRKYFLTRYGIAS